MRCLDVSIQWVISMYIGGCEKLPTTLIYSAPKVKNFLLESILTFLLIIYKAAAIFKLSKMTNPVIHNHKQFLKKCI